VTGTSPGTFAKAVISSPSATAGSIDDATLNGRGFYVTTNPSTVTAVLDNATGKFNWCVYGSDFPPNAKDNSSGGYDLKGSPPFVINNTIEWNASTYSGGVITALTDATGCPGVWCGKNGETAGLLNCCVPGTTNCSGTCKTNGTYTTQDGACAGTCNAAYVQLRDQCANVIDENVGTYTELNCASGCGVTLAQCKSLCTSNGYDHALVNINPTCYCFCTNDKLIEDQLAMFKVWCMGVEGWISQGGNQWIYNPYVYYE
jgi:hypothetical protein